MTVESAIYINTLQPVNPPGTDPTSEGDNHIRLIKQVLQNQFSGASRAWQIPSAKAVSTNYTVLQTDGESTLYVATAGGAVTLTLPALAAGDAGWKVRICKTSSDVNPIFVTPNTGTINSGGIAGLAKARRCIPGIVTEAIWDGTNWFQTRALALPIGSCIEYHGSSLPPGYEWPNGQTLSSSANYPEYNSAMGGLTTRDKRGYTSICLDNLGGASAGRLPSGYITGTAVGNTGGVDAVTLSAAQIPAHQHNVYLYDPTHSHSLSAAASNAGGSSPSGGGSVSGIGTVTTTAAAATGITIGSVSGVGANNNLTAANAGGGGNHSNLQPSIMVSNILVVE
jgi:microcystin-dependent protein